MKQTAELVKKCQERMKSIRDKNYFTLRFGKTKKEIEQAKEMENKYKQKVNLLLDTLLENNMCSVVGDELIQTFKSE
jgi:hypothetical protein